MSDRQRYLRRRALGLCGRCGKVPSEFAYCDGCQGKLGRPEGEGRTGRTRTAEEFKAAVTVAADRQRQKLAAGVRTLSPEERLQLEQQMRAAGRLR